MCTWGGTVGEQLISDGPAYVNGSLTDVQCFKAHIDDKNSPMHPEVFVFYQLMKVMESRVAFQVVGIGTW